jgi:hypothetical protein
MKSQFNKQKVVLATMHGKEKIIAPLLKEAFDMDCFLAP